MGAAVARLADIAIATSDNPRTEIRQDPRRRGARDAGKAAPPRSRPPQGDRARARIGRSGDTILLAGKGHETYQVWAP